MNKFNRIAVLALLTFWMLPASAAVITATYAVSDAAAQHGLWTNSVKYSSIGEDAGGVRYFSFDSGTLLTQFNDGTAKLVGTASNNGVTWDIDVLMQNYSTTPNGNEKCGGDCSDLTDWEFYEFVDGTISSVFSGNPYEVSVTRIGPRFQMGTGANDKTADYGASTWMSPTLPTGTFSGKWDLNMNLTSVPAPEPVTLATLMSGIAGLMLRRRR